MPFVKLDCGILDSTLWFDNDARNIFITALLMAEPFVLKEPTVTYEVCAIKETGFVVPPGWYGFIRAAGPAIVRRAGLDQKAGSAALKRLASPEAESRSPDFEGRRLVRIDGGYLILNFQKYRDKDYGAAERMRLWRQRQKEIRYGDRVTRDADSVTRDGVIVTVVTQAEAEAEGIREDLSRISRGEVTTEEPVRPVAALFDEFWRHYPRKAGKGKALAVFRRLKGPQRAKAGTAVIAFAEAWRRATPDRLQFIPHPATWLGQGRFDDDPAEWVKQATGHGNGKASSPSPEVRPPKGRGLADAESSPRRAP